MPGVRFSSGHTSWAGVEWDVEIYDSAYSGSPVSFRLGGRGIDITHDAVNDRRISPIIASKASFDFWIEDATHEGLVTDLLGASESRFTVKIKREGALYWLGYVMPDISQYEDVAYPYLFKIDCVDGLSRLKTIDYTQTEVGYLNVVKHICAALTGDDTLKTRYFSGSDIFLRTAVNWWNEAHGSPSLAKDPLTLTRFDGAVFETTKSDGSPKIKSCYEVLVELASGWNARLFWSAGAWFFEQPDYRLNNDFNQRRYSYSGTALSQAVTNYDRSIVQNNTGAKLATPHYDWFPALRKAEVNYKHGTAKNWVEGYAFKYSSNSTGGATTIKNMTLNEDATLRLHGRVRAKMSASSTKPWYWRLGIQVKIGSTDYWDRNITVVAGANILAFNPTTWNIGGGEVEITAGLFWGSGFDGEFFFSVQSLPIPSGASGDVTFNVTNLGALDIDGSNVTLSGLTWSFPDLVLEVVEPGNARESEKTYFIDREQDSDTVELALIVGDAVKYWTPGKLQVSPDGSTWADSLGGWYVDGVSGSTTEEFGMRLVKDIIGAQKTPVKKMHATVMGVNMYFHNIFSDLNSTEWLMLGGTYNTERDEIGGEWWGHVYSNTNDGDTTVIYDPPTAPNPNIPTEPQRVAVDTSQLLLSLLGSVVTSAAMTGGSTTTATLTAALQSGAFVDGETVKIVNPFTGASETLEIAATNTESATALQFVTAPTQDFPAYSYIIKDPSYPLAQGNSNVATYTITTGDPAIQIGAKKLWEHTVIIGSGSGTVNIGSTAGGTEYWGAIDYDTSGSIVYSQPKYFHTAGTIFFSGFSGTLTIKLYFK